MKVAVIGSRNCARLTTKMMKEHLPEFCTMIISGGAVGVDALAEQLAREEQIPFYKLEPEYSIYGRRAPLVRNQEIIRDADQVLAFWDHKSRGTANVIDQCLHHGIPVKVIAI